MTVKQHKIFAKIQTRILQRLTLQSFKKWHNKGGGKNIAAQPVIEIQVNKTKLE